MNERIRELLEQAGVTDNWNKADWYSMSPEMIEKFAELIVKKCMDVAKYHTPDTEECEYTWLIHDKIQEYFGVEE